MQQDNAVMREQPVTITVLIKTVYCQNRTWNATKGGGL